MRDLGHYQLMIKMMRLSHLLTVAGTDYLKKHDLTLVQFNVLMILKYENSNGCNQKLLCDRLSVKGPNMTTLIRRMLANGFIDRKESVNDEREKLIFLTPKGTALLKKIEPNYYKQVESIFGQIPDKHIAIIESELNTIESKLKDKI